MVVRVGPFGRADAAFPFLRQRFSFFDSCVDDLACATDQSP
jgi:hypothetical protein